MKALKYELPDELACDHDNPAELAPASSSLSFDVRMCQWQLGSETYVVISVPAYDTEAADALTAAEHDIVSRLLLGQTYAQIARARGSCSTTVTNQIRAIFEKLGVDSGAQLAQKLAPVVMGPSHNDRD